MIVAPSILSADFNNLLEEVNKINNADFIHIDVMDGHFVPNISFGTCVYKNLRKYTKQVFDVHLMIDNPLFYAQSFAESGADIITFHLECKNDTIEVIDKLKSLNVKVGISIKPKTNVEVLLPYLDKVDLVLVMSVEPGFGGQKFLPNALDKIKYLSDYKKKMNLSYIIEVDGGINFETAKMCKECGVSAVVCGTYVFKSSNPYQTIEELKNL
ncbi:MAG: ribulose-phosphate 3-epimerase [Coprobacillus sp. 28_7]|nr:MAG: ribulose-phosphate 3-epimerase [Coprobacillus sp. 28_7]